MAENTAMPRRNIVVRCLAAVALIAVYCAWVLGASTLITAATSTSANARGRGGWGRGRAWRGGWGRGWYGGYGAYYVAPGPACYWSRRWRRTICTYY
jgi:hypothetical protein